MQDSISANHLHPTSFKHSPFPSSKLPPNHSLLKVTQFPTEGFLPFSENSKKILSRVFSQERIDSRQNERIASNLTSSSSKKRLILKNKQKFPSDFFQDANPQINHELLEKRLTSHAESLVPSISISHLHQDLVTHPEMLDFINADEGNIHETPKFSCDNSPVLGHEAQYIQEPRYNNLFEAYKDRAGTANILTNSIDHIKKLEFNRIYSALLPNTRGLGNLSERVLNEGPGPAPKKDNFQVKKAQEIGLSGFLNESNSELGKPVSRVSSQESLYRPIIFYNNELKEKDPYVNTSNNISNNAKIRTKRNKQLEEIIALKRRSSEILSKASQSALPKLRNYAEPSNSNISLLKAKAEGFLGLNLSYARKEDRGVKAFDYRLRPTENSALNTRNTSEGSPLLYNDSFMNRTRPTEESDPFSHLVLTSAKKPGYEVIVHSARKRSGGSEANGENLSHSDGEEKSGTALRRYTSVEGKGGALLSAKELERKMNGRSEGGARNKAKIILHRRHASMQLDHAVLLKYEQKKGIEEKEKPMRHASAQKIVGKPPSYQGQVNNYFKESPGVKTRVGKVDRIQQSRSASNLRPDTMEIKSRINSKGPAPQKDYNSAFPEQKNNEGKEQNYSTQIQSQAQVVEQRENNQNVANKVGTRQRGFTFGKDSKEDGKNNRGNNNTVAKSAVQEDTVIIEDRRESETSYRVETKEDVTPQDLMQKLKN